MNSWGIERVNNAEPFLARIRLIGVHDFQSVLVKESKQVMHNRWHFKKSGPSL